MLSKVYDYITKYHMIEKGDRIVAGISGGADSICLLYVLKRIVEDGNAQLIAVHINHGIRGAEAERDQKFVEELCGHMGIEFHKFSYDVRKIASSEGLSEEEAGRKVRYEAFLNICETRKCNKIAIAHNKNDNAETVLFHLFRGTGMKGLTGIEPTRVINTDFGDVTLIRPLLCVERKEIEEFLTREDITYQIDSTNLTEDYARNKIRNKILNYAVGEINSGSIDNINAAAAQLREVKEYIEANVKKRYCALVEQTASIYRIPVKALLKEPQVIQKEIVLRIMEKLAKSKKDLEARHVEAVLGLCSRQVGKYIHLPYDMIAEREYEGIKFFHGGENSNTAEEYKITGSVLAVIPGRTILPEYRKIIETELINYKKSEPIPKSSCAKWFNYDKIENAVEIRTRREGDYIQINEAGGNKKIKDYFIDHKIPRRLRDSQILIADGSHVMWIPGMGERMSEKYKVDENTSKVLLMKMFDMEDNADDR